MKKEYQLFLKALHDSDAANPSKVTFSVKHIAEETGLELSENQFQEIVAKLVKDRYIIPAIEVGGKYFSIEIGRLGIEFIEHRKIL